MPEPQRLFVRGQDHAFFLLVAKRVDWKIVVMLLDKQWLGCPDVIHEDLPTGGSHAKGQTVPESERGY